MTSPFTITGIFYVLGKKIGFKNMNICLDKTAAYNIERKFD